MPVDPGPFRSGDLVRIRGERWRVTRWTPGGSAALVEAIGCEATARGTSARFLLPFEPVDRLPVAVAPRVVRPATWRRAARHVLAHAAPSWHSLRAAARAAMTLVPFQLEPALAITSGRACRLLIADDVGLGKTVQAGLVIAEVLAREPDAHAVVVCPAGLREQWQGELRDRFGLSAAIVDAAGLARLSQARDAASNPWATEPLIITSIDYVKRPEVMRSLEALIWDVVVFDEAHALAGASDRAGAASALAGRARRVLLLTATPHSGDDEAFRRMCALGQLPQEDPLLVFRRSRAEAGVGGTRRTVTLAVRPSPAERAMHHALLTYARRVWTTEAGTGARLAIIVLLRRASSSAASLARSLERRLTLLSGLPRAGAQLSLPFADSGSGDEEPSALLAVRGLGDAREEQELLERVLAQAQNASRAESKLAALTRLLRRVREPVLVFTEYRDTLEHLATQLPGRAVQLHGGLTARERRDAAREFTNAGADLLLATDAASEGLNLHRRCRLVINLELPWTPVRLEQRIGRVDRIGQAHTVHAINLVGRDTGEESVVSRLAARMDRARGALAALGAAPPTDEHRVAAAILQDHPLPEVDLPRRAPFVTATAGPELRDAARTEAVRVGSARALLRAGAGEAGARPLLSVVRSRRHRPAEAIWVWRVVFVDQGDRWLWERLLSIRAPMRRGTLTPRTIRALLHPAELSAAAEADACSRLAALAHDVRPYVAVMTRREQAIAAVLDQQTARLAATLVQPGLFSHRPERAAAAQRSLLAEALERSAARLRQLEALRELRIDGHTLVFAVALQ